MSAREQLPPLIITFLVVDIIAVALRIWIRTHIKKSFGFDDGALCIALLGFILLAILSLICLSYGYGATEMLPGYNAILGAKYFLIVQLVYMITLYVSKLSVGLVLYRLAEARKAIRISLMVSMVVLTIWTTVTVLTISLQCRPLAAAWGEGTGTCVSGEVISNTGYSFSSMDIATSWFYALLPIYLLKGIQISRKLKASVLILLGLGVVSNIATLIRLKYLIDIRYVPSAASSELVRLYLDSFIYSVSEIGLTIFTASLAALRPLLTYLVSKTLHSNSDDTTNQSKSKGWRMELRDLNPPASLHDRPVSDTESQIDILPRRGRIVKHTSFEVKYSETQKF
ncbi:hypothetical protein VSDG_01719 [Cytospora chrysosperma]|uniref:Rhodopsin domain-containing protein n=1 Tax=Cytospora chrysosperma TaxID=252740 RepID=A0A423WHQ0_CYTCH|nr:hypothetical protein VSDG_01719 [Valsa sordida]